MKEQPSNKEKGIVKEIFERPSSIKKRLSALYTHKPIQKTSPLSQKRIPQGEEFPPGIEISSMGVRLLQLGRNKEGRVEIRRFDMVDSLSLSEALKLIVRRNRIRGDVVISIPDNLVQIYNLTFPPMPDEELFNVIEARIADLKSMRFKGKEIQFGYLKTPYHVLVAAISTQKLDEIKRALKKARLRPQAIEFGTTSLIRLEKFGLTASPGQETHLWLNLGDEITMAASRDGDVIFAAPLSISSQAINNALETESADSIHMLEKFVVEVEHNFKSLAGELSGYDRIFLGGTAYRISGANFAKLERFLNSRSGKPVQRIDPFKIFNLSDLAGRPAKSDDAGKLMTRTGEFSLAGALATRALDRIDQRVDLLSLRTKKKKMPLIEAFRYRFVRAATAVLLFIFLAMSFSQVSLYYRSCRRVSQLTSRLSQLKKELAHRQNMEVSISEKEGGLLKRKGGLEERARQLKDSLRSPEEFSRVLIDLSSLLPENVWVTRLDFKDKKFIVRGQTQKIERVINFIERLNISKSLNKSTFNYTEKKSEEGASLFDFEVTIAAK